MSNVKSHMFRAALLNRKNRTLVYPECRTDAGVFVAMEPFIVLQKDPSATELGQALLTALNHSGRTVPTLTDWKTFSQPRLLAAGVKSEAAYQRNSKLVLIEMTGSEVVLKPTKNGGVKGDSKGFSELLGSEVIISSNENPNEIGLAALAVLQVCADEA